MCVVLGKCLLLDRMVGAGRWEGYSDGGYGWVVLKKTGEGRCSGRKD